MLVRERTGCGAQGEWGLKLTPVKDRVEIVCVRRLEKPGEK
jgi:hypothetical protein